MANLSCSTDHMDQIQTLRGLTSSDDQEERSNCITDLVSFAKGCEEKINCLLDALGWSDGVQEGTQLVPCPFDPGHRVPTTSLERHSKSCRLHTLGYSREDKAQMVDTTFFYEGKNVTAVNIDQCLQSQIIEDAKKNCLQDNDLQKSRYVLREGDFSSHPVEVPETLDREMCTLTRADRIAIYDHVVLQAKKENPGAEGSDDLYVDLTSKLKRDKTEPKEKSNLEVLAEMRDYKRRRQSYRAKNVHITRRSHTEIIREVIAVHTAELARIWKGDDDDEEEVKVKEDEEEEEREGDRSLSHDQQSGYSERRTVRQWGAEQEKRDVSRRSTERSHENEEIEKQRRRGSYGDGAKQYIGGSSREKKIAKYRTRERDDRIARHGSPGKHRNRSRSRSRSRESHRDRRRRSRDRDRRSNRDRRDRD